MSQELLKELDRQLATNSLSPPEIQVLAQLLVKNYSQISAALTFALQKKPPELKPLTPEQRQQVTEFLAQHGFQKKDPHV